MNTKTQVKERRILTPTERDGLKRKLADGQEDRTPDEQHFVENEKGDAAELDTEKRIKRVLSEGEPDSLGKGERTRKEGRFKELREALRKKMVPRKAMQYRPQDGYLFQRAANAVARDEMSPAFDAMAMEFKNLARELYPDVPEMSNLDTIRPN